MDEKKKASPTAGKRESAAVRAVRGITTSELESIANLPRNERLACLSTLALLAGGVAVASEA